MRLLVLTSLIAFLWSCYSNETKKADNAGSVPLTTDDSVTTGLNSARKDSILKNMDMVEDKTRVNDSGDLPGKLPNVESPAKNF